jgi:Ca2+-binding EF-hand superfamily protein
MVDNSVTDPVDIKPSDINAESRPLSKEEIATFNEILSGYLAGHQNNRLEELFNLFDRNKNGTLSPVEIKTVMEQVSGHGFSDQQLQHLLNVVDKNHDGEVDIHEFILVLKRLTD